MWYIKQNFDNLTSADQNTLLLELIDIAVKINLEKILAKLVEKYGALEVDENLQNIINDEIY